MEKSTTKQVGNNPNPSGKGGFGEHPENRSDGRWDKDNSFSYWMNFFKAMSVEEFKEYERIKPEKDRTMAETLAYARVFRARIELKEFQEVANRTEGMPKTTGTLEMVEKIEQREPTEEEKEFGKYYAKFLKQRITSKRKPDLLDKKGKDQGGKGKLDRV